MDEADRMVHLGFEADLTFILDALPSETMQGEDTGEQMDVDGEMVKKGRTRVTTLFSATMPAAVERLARKYLKRPAVITIGEAGRAVDTVEQRVEFVSGDEKKKYGSTWPIDLCVLTEFIQAATFGDSKQWTVCISDHCLCQSEKDRGHGCQGPVAGRRTSIRCWGYPACDLMRMTVECSDAAFGQKPRATRGIAAGVAQS